MTGFGDGFLSSLGSGFRAAGAILSPAVDEQQARERLQQQAQIPQLLQLLPRIQEMQREQQFRSGMRPDMTQEQLASHAAQYGSPDKVMDIQQKSLDRKEATKVRASEFLQTMTLRQDDLDRKREEFMQRTDDAQSRARFEQWYKTQSLENKKAQDSVMNDLRRQGIELRGSIHAAAQAGRDTPHAIVGVDETGNQSINWARPSEGAQSFSTKPVGSANIDLRDRQINIRQISGRVASETKGERDVLAAANRYGAYKDTGDNAQAVTMAAETLRRAAQTGNQRFKGEAEKLLGGGYGGGSIQERIGNFLSTEATGTPTAKTMAKLDALVQAAEGAAVENLGQRTTYYAGQARGKKLPLQEAIGMPYVHRNRVVFPDGTHATFKDGAAAKNAAGLWKDQPDE